MGDLYIPPEVHRFASGMSAFDGPVDRVQDPVPSTAIFREIAEEELRNDLEAFAGWIETSPIERAYCEAFKGFISIDELWRVATDPKAPMATRGESFAEVIRRFMEDNRADLAKRAAQLEVQHG